MHLTPNNIGFVRASHPIPYAEAHECFLKLYRHYDRKFLLESKDISPVYGRLSLIGLGGALRLRGKDDHFSLDAFTDEGVSLLSRFSKELSVLCPDYTRPGANRIEGVVPRDQDFIEEGARSRRRNIAQVIRLFLQTFSLDQKTLLGLYGAFSYDFVRLFEPIADGLPPNDIPDYDLVLCDTFVFFDHLKETAEIVVFRTDEARAEAGISRILSELAGEAARPEYAMKDARFSLSETDYKNLVEIARDHCRRGEIFEVVFSNVLSAGFSGDPLALYLKYRDTNPSPYLFYFDFGDNQLVGASPEMMVRCERGTVHLRPISGTARRGDDPITDHENMLALLADPKERAELDMLIDLGRNDLARVCEPGIRITDYRFVEKYSRVMHTVAHLSGRLAAGNTALDALIATLNAGTLTGAPKVAAMNLIEQYETERRGYYGGVIGYFTLSGDMDTGIIIRTAHIQNGRLRFQVGATLLYDSVPEKEYRETLHKAQAFLDTFL